MPLPDKTSIAYQRGHAEGSEAKATGNIITYVFPEDDYQIGWNDAQTN